MRVFVTGATGFVGTAVVRELLGAGHQVLGLARSDRGAAALEAAGAAVHRGSLEDLDSLRSGAAASDGVVHMAFVHDFSDYLGAVRTDLRAVEAIGDALAGTGRPFVTTSGFAGIAHDRAIVETDTGDPAAAPRAASEAAALAYAERGVRASALRLAATVHGAGDHGFVPTLIEVARATGVSAYPGDGANRWPAVARRDAARLYRLAVESAPAGARLHGVAEEGVPVRDIAEAIGRRLGLPVTSVPPEEAETHFGWIGRVFSADLAASSALTRQRTGWEPTGPGLLADLDGDHYFAAPAATV
ncbi:SDR family oxidoreductase [Streptomonospora nanhaiensis]|uniref:Nucleoside-diphosphate-sugar epimerase n=1 Tax=Streptomonospora nanhaiensis TaxID=1323731 RepID=A0A853BSU4_9ACTN|nr:SDR family oxidoreductase [Streptomonospora nanhaiensis]MBX9387014.1 SDR family oxidoreductase [Streptomonospora nanhaiensis]NYI97795.1 nucleoside-diphosphate-sugar epimerase [Streptomonospora nanhaiensis]